MKRRTLTVRLPDRLATEIEAESHAAGLSKSDVVRRRLEGRSRRGASPPPSFFDLAADLIGSVSGMACRGILRRARSTTCGSGVTAKTVVVDSGMLIGLIRRDDQFHAWAVDRSRQFPAPWLTCEAVLSEAFLLAGPPGRDALAGFLRRGLVHVRFDLAVELAPVLGLIEKYGNVPMSLADACLVRMTETLADPVLLTTDADFRIYRRHSRKVVPCVMP